MSNYSRHADLEEIFRKQIKSVDGIYKLVTAQGVEHIARERLVEIAYAVDPSSLVVSIQIRPEFGRSAILLELEKQVVKMADTLSFSFQKPVVPYLLNSLRGRLHYRFPNFEIAGRRTHLNDLPHLVLKTFSDISSRLSGSSRLVIFLEVEASKSIEELASFFEMFLSHLPLRVKLFMIHTKFSVLDDGSRCTQRAEYFWNNPTHL